LLISSHNDIVNTLVELFDNVDSGVDGKLRIEDTALETELFEEKLNTVTTINICDEDDDLAFD
jgi:hypothetical protein